MRSLPTDTEAASHEAIVEQLGRILASDAFKGLDRSSKLLRHLVQRTLDGKTATLKEFTIGTEVLGKDSSFDPRVDTIVRAEVSRLRSRLEKYYATRGQADPVVITLQRGSYAPVFEPRTADKGRRLLADHSGWLTVGIVVAAVLSMVMTWALLRAPQSEGAVSVAVLPFANMSGDPNQEFFSDGISEEINTALASIQNLRVVARTSAFQFRNRNEDVQAIADALHATHLVEGSVRKAGTRLRITAQLIRAEDGVHVWSNSYDRELTDIFSIQEDIATGVADALRKPLDLEPGKRLVANRPANKDTYELFLRARAALRKRTREELDLFEEVVARDPNFAPAWAKLSEARREMALDFERRGERWRRAALIKGAAEAALRAISLDPDYAGGYGALAGTYFWRGKWGEAVALAKKGLALDPEDPELLNNYAGTLRALGYLKESLSVREQLALVEPFVPLYNRQTAELLLANGKMEAGVKGLEGLHGAAFATPYLSRAYALQGRFTEAADLLVETPFYPNARPMIESVVQVLRSVATGIKPPAELPAFDSEANFVYIYAGHPERMLEWPEKALENGDYRPMTSLWWPMPSIVRKTERFKALVREAGMVGYWRANGWPDLCRPIGADDFVCD